MSIFRRESSPSPLAASEPSGPSQKRRVTHVAPGTRLRGEVVGETELLIEGEIEGEIRVEATVTVGAEGAVAGPITAPVVRVAGRVVGGVTATDRVEVAPTGSVEGDIAAPRIVISEGAFFKGRVEMKSDRAREARRPRGAGEPESNLVETGKP
ncbi:MAG TPA: polymer-forming cytoskeletal protein [Thermoanaerobaculia bacterium]|jgi:cytoskeletal protein CcmA (bactofilin family)|nr:polymer-forming cytoskeletal protein [Thermoanaerobaculia bacterium]